MPVPHELVKLDDELDFFRGETSPLDVRAEIVKPSQSATLPAPV